MKKGWETSEWFFLLFWSVWGVSFSSLMLSFGWLERQSACKKRLTWKTHFKTIYLNLLIKGALLNAHFPFQVKWLAGYFLDLSDGHIFMTDVISIVNKGLLIVCWKTCIFGHNCIIVLSCGSGIVLNWYWCNTITAPFLGSPKVDEKGWGWAKAGASTWSFFCHFDTFVCLTGRASGL